MVAPIPCLRKCAPSGTGERFVNGPKRVAATGLQRIAEEVVTVRLYFLTIRDLFFEVVTRRYEQRSIVLTTNKPFAQWQDISPNAACVVTLVDRLVHRAEIVQIQGDSYRLKEAKERAARKKKARSQARTKGQKK